MTNQGKQILLQLEGAIGIDYNVCMVQIFAGNPLDREATAITTLNLPPGITLLETDGTVNNGSIVWKASVAAHSPLMPGYINIQVSRTPGGATTLPGPTIVFVDQSGNSSPHFQADALQIQQNLCPKMP